ncbi:hypothetical protein ACPV5S_19340 [Vibrio astriarenae]
MDDTKWKGWFKKGDQEQRTWLFNYLIKRKHKLTKTDYTNSRLSSWAGDNESSACQLLQSLDIESAEDRELLKAMKNAWDKVLRERKSHNIKRTYSFSPTSLRAIKLQAHTRNVTIEKHLNDLIFTAGDQLKQLWDQERDEKKSYLDANKKLREQNRQLKDEAKHLKASLENAIQQRNEMQKLIDVQQQLKIAELNGKNSEQEGATNPVKTKASDKSTLHSSTTPEEIPRQKQIRKRKTWLKTSGGSNGG